MPDKPTRSVGDRSLLSINLNPINSIAEDQSRCAVDLITPQTGLVVDGDFGRDPRRRLSYSEGKTLTPSNEDGDVSEEKSESPADVKVPAYPEQPNLCGQMKVCEVVYTNDPGSFYVQLKDDLEGLDYIMDRLNSTGEGVYCLLWHLLQFKISPRFNNYYQGPDLYAFIAFIAFIGSDDDDLNLLLILIFDY